MEDEGYKSLSISIGINVGAARIFSGYEGKSLRRVVGVGLDTPSMDHGASTHFSTHVELAEANIFGLENLADLSVSSTGEESSWRGRSQHNQYMYSTIYCSSKRKRLYSSPPLPKKK